jgi:3-deoxy-manno-octulosonate cytidylyltransferase (CMP-KDO synthetase)
MITVVIPARMASSRFPGKPIANILGMPLLEHVRRRSLLVKGVDQVVVATCDVVIKDLIESFGGKVVMTKDTHTRCTDRVNEAMLHLEGDIVAIVQGDEPLLIPENVSQVVQPLLDDPSLNTVNLLTPLESSDDYLNRNIVKAVCDIKGNAIFFTRAPVPFFCEKVTVPVYRQTGIIAFRTSFLKKFSALSETPLEKAESIDMMRVIENGVRIFGVKSEYISVGVDRPEDVGLVESVLTNDPMQRDLFNKISNQFITK